MKDVFLSHAHPDRQSIVIPFVRELGKRRISYWLDEGEIHWGDKIGSSINEGLTLSRYIVVFLTTSFFGRNWTETELSAAFSRENSEGRVVVLPIIVGNPAIILAAHPLLRDKSYITWDLGIEQLVDHLENRLFAVTARELTLPVRDSANTVTIFPRKLIDFLEDLDGGHGFLSPAKTCSVLRECGFLADLVPGTGIVINGYFIPNSQGDWGLPGTRDLHLVRLLYKLVTGENVVRKQIGRGWNYRAIVRDLVTAMRALHDKPLPPPDAPPNFQGRWIDDETVCLYWEPSRYTEHYVVLCGETEGLMAEITSTKDCAHEYPYNRTGTELFFMVRAVNRFGQSVSRIISSRDFAQSEQEYWDTKSSPSDIWTLAKKHDDGWEDLGW